MQFLKEELKILKIELSKAKKETLQVMILISTITIKTFEFMVFQKGAEKKMIVKTFFFK